MAAERPTGTGRSGFGSVCATAVACACLAYVFAGCLNPLTDDQPASRPAQGAAVTPGSSPPGEDGLQGTPGGGFDDLVDEEGEGTASNPNAGPSTGAGGGAGDAGTVESDAGPDSGSSGAP